MSSGPAGPTIAEVQSARVARALESARAVTAGDFDAAVEAANSAAGGEFIVIATPGGHVTGEARDNGRLVLTSRRLFVSTERPNLSGQGRSWPVADMRAITSGPSEKEMTLLFTDGHEEVFAVDRCHRQWLDSVGKLLTLPGPVTSWYGDPADKDRPVTVPDGMAVMALWRAEGEVRDRRGRYQVVLNGDNVAKIGRGQRIELPLAPGRHIIFLRYIGAESQFFPFEARAGQVVRFCCEPGGFIGMTQTDLHADPPGYLRLRRL